VVRLIFEEHPDALVERDFCGTTPLYLVYHSSTDPKILKSMLKFRPSLVLERIHSFSGPDMLQIVCSSWAMLQGVTPADVRCNADLSKQWEKVVLTVSAAHTCRHEKHPVQTHELHTALELPCSPEILSWFIRMYPDQLMIPMTDGKLPLHAFASSKSFVEHTMVNDILQLCIDFYPNAARIWWNGKLPVHLAIESGYLWTNGLQRLLNAYPEALQMPNYMSGLVPFMMAANDSCDLNTLYSLLREGPELVNFSFSNCELSIIELLAKNNGLGNG
jgi:hypothetical protein